MKAFANSGARKDEAEGRKVQKELAALLETTKAGVDSFLTAELGKWCALPSCSKAISIMIC